MKDGSVMSISTIFQLYKDGERVLCDEALFRTLGSDRICLQWDLNLQPQRAELIGPHENHY